MRRWPIRPIRRFPATEALGDSVSVGLQHGVPLSAYVGRLSGMRFEPEGWTERMGYANSIVDYVFRWLDRKFPGEA